MIRPGELRFSRGFLTNISLLIVVQAAVAKEGLRMFPGVIAHPRVVPQKGAVISGTFIPGGVRFSPPSFHPFPQCQTFFSYTVRT
jgi:hypothetical protein